MEPINRVIIPKAVCTSCSQQKLLFLVPGLPIFYKDDENYCLCLFADKLCRDGLLVDISSSHILLLIIIWAKCSHLNYYINKLLSSG